MRWLSDFNDSTSSPVPYSAPVRWNGLFENQRKLPQWTLHWSRGRNRIFCILNRRNASDIRRLIFSSVNQTHFHRIVYLSSYWRKLLVHHLMGQYCFVHWRLSSSVMPPAGGPAGRRARGRSACLRPGAWESAGRHCTAGQPCYVPLGRHLVFVVIVVDEKNTRDITGVIC